MRKFKFFAKSEKNVNAIAENQTIVEDNSAEGASENQATDCQNDKKDQPISRNVYNLIILDESGSMSSIYEPALSGVNETLQTIRNAQEDNPEQNHFVTLVSFDSSRYNEIYDVFPIKNAKDITKEDYRPNAMTPLYDAMGKALNKMRNQVDDKKDVVLVTVITDGYENASREYSGKAIKALIEDLKKSNWVFTYIGANQDVEAVAESMSIDNRMSFCADMEGTNEMFEKERKSRKKFFSRLSNTGAFRIGNDIKGDFFEGF